MGINKKLQVESEMKNMGNENKKDFNFIRWTYYWAKRLKGFIKRD